MSLLSKNEYKLIECAAEIMIYFERHKLIEIAKKILVECALSQPLNARQWIGKNINRIANEIYQDCLNKGEYKIVKSLHLTKSFLYRIVMFGRPGSGRRTQANYMAARFNLVLIDADTLIYQHLKGVDERLDDPYDRELQRAFYYDNSFAKSKALINIIARRVLENDCLTRGWILLNFTHTLQDFKDILQHFKIPPNKLVYLKCNERTCMLRLFNMTNMRTTSQIYLYYEHEMRFFKRNENVIVDYLLNRQETVCVKATERSETVKANIMGAIVKSPYLMG